MGKDFETHLDATGGHAVLFDCSSGAVLAADAAGKFPGVTRVALYEPPFIVDNTREPRETSFVADTEALIAKGDRSGALKRFTKHVGMPGKTHMVKADAVAPSVKEFLAAASTR